MKTFLLAFFGGMIWMTWIIAEGLGITHLGNYLWRFWEGSLFGQIVWWAGLALIAWQSFRWFFPKKRKLGTGDLRPSQSAFSRRDAFLGRSGRSKKMPASPRGRSETRPL